MPTIKFKPEQGEPLDPSPLCFKVSSSLRRRVKAVPDWQKRLREELPGLIAQWEKETKGEH
ncbi:MAG TPA: hypothetical protein DCE56_15380 [Cyanobacteria bacterium UBA8553]|nr:hypothetical protein [Cyanobacteria bacterium UBA8553]HAJ63069.1 hypothetical protein [Cyanobacteria bacterium UBA8543]